ncbi:MAG: chemotaxis protein CheD [Desulfovibrionaceae bacterium]
MNRINVSISDMKYSTKSEDVLVTHSLGSCVGLAAYDPQTRVGGLIHCLLPQLRGNSGKDVQNPYMYVTSGVPVLIRTLLTKGAKRNRLILKAAGGGHMMTSNRLFDVGKQNSDILRRLLAHNHMSLKAEDFGGTLPRTVYFYLDTGRVVVKSLGKEWEL